MEHAYKPYLEEVVVDREIRPRGHGDVVAAAAVAPEPNFTKLARGK